MTALRKELAELAPLLGVEPPPREPPLPPAQDKRVVEQATAASAPTAGLRTIRGRSALLRCTACLRDS